MVASSLSFENHKKTFNWKYAFIPGKWGNGYQKRGWATIGKSIENIVYRPISIIGETVKAITSFVHKRSIKTQSSNLLGDMWIEVTFDEKTVDEYQITNHPVETGGVISDHMFRLPTRYTLRGGFFGNGLFNTIRIIGNVFYNLDKNKTLFGQTLLQSQYTTLLEMQQSKQLFNIVTPKRIYKNMAIKSISVETDIDTENVLNYTVECVEIIQAKTSITLSLIENLEPSIDFNTTTQVGPAQTDPILESTIRQINNVVLGR